jgi:hypothetical protein
MASSFLDCRQLLDGLRDDAEPLAKLCFADDQWWSEADNVTVCRLGLKDKILVPA